MSAPAPATVPVVTVTRDLPAGTVLRATDLARSPLPRAGVPSGAVPTVEDAVGRTTAGPVRAGEALTDVRLVGGSLLDGYPGLVAAPVRIGDAGAVALLEAGDRVDILAADPQGGEPATVVSRRALVAALPREVAEGPSLGGGGLVLLAVPEGEAQALASAGVSHYLSVVLRQ